MACEPEPLWSKDDVAEYLGVSTSTVDRYRQDERFPPPIRLSQRSLRWRPEQVVAWTRSRQVDRTSARADRRPGSTGVIA